MSVRIVKAAKPAATTSDWRHSAGCRDSDPELHFPIGNSGPALLQVEQAKAVCRRCPVRDACLSWALDNSDHGVWGGMSEEERRAYKRRTSRHRAGSAA